MRQVVVADLSVGVAGLNVHLRAAVGAGLMTLEVRRGRRSTRIVDLHGGQVVGSLPTWICDVSWWRAMAWRPCSLLAVDNADSARTWMAEGTSEGVGARVRMRDWPAGTTSGRNLVFLIFLISLIAGWKPVVMKMLKPKTSGDNSGSPTWCGSRP